MALIALHHVPEELRARDMVVLDPGFLLARYTRESFALVASRKRQLAFGITLAVTDDAPGAVPWLQEVVGMDGVTLLSIPVLARPPESYLVSPYTDVLPVHMALFLDPVVPDEDGPRVQRLRELMGLSREHARSRTRMPTPLRKELRRLRAELWAKARLFRWLGDAPGVLRFRFPTFGGVEELSLQLESASRSVSTVVRELHRRLHFGMGVLMDPYNAAALTDATLRARTEFEAEAVLRACLCVVEDRIGSGRFRAMPCSSSNNCTPPTTSSRPRKVERHLGFLREVAGGLFTVRMAEKRSSRTVSVSGEVRVHVSYEVTFP
ncbi:MAG: hypothetical protein QXP81_06365 [Nitrososphaerota archaeon]